MIANSEFSIISINDHKEENFLIAINKAGRIWFTSQ